MDIPLHITLQKPPAGVNFALQKGHANICEAMQIQHSGTDDLYFSLPVTLKGDQQKDALPDFKGPFVQGPLNGRFIYITIGVRTGQGGAWSGRLKIPLTGVAWTLVDEVAKNPQSGLRTTVPGTGKKGMPNCATVKPFDGWHAASL